MADENNYQGSQDITGTNNDESSLDINRQMRPRRDATQPLGSHNRPTRERSIRDIKREGVNNKKNAGTPAFADDKKFSSRRYKRAGNKKIFGAIGALIGLFLLFIIIGNATHQANLSLYVANMNLNAQEPVVLEGLDGYEIRALTVSQSTTVSATTSEQVSLPATGEISVYNNTDQPQRLISNTRFEAPNGTEYITPVAITVPAASGGSPGVLTAVKVESNVTGQQANQDIVGETLSVPGLIGSELEGEVYAEATTLFDGGFEGERLVADQADVQEAIDSLGQNLEDSFSEMALAQIPAGFVLIEVVSEPVLSTSQKESGDSAVDIVVEAQADVVLVADNALLNVLSRAEGVEVGDNIVITNLADLNFELIEATTDRLEFELLNPVVAEYLLDGEAITEALTGLSEAEVEEVLDAEPSIDRYDLSVSPFWRNSIPSNPEKINVDVIQSTSAPDRAEPTNDSIIQVEADVESEPVESTESSVMRTEIIE